jgi:hypothetical protein
MINNTGKHRWVIVLFTEPACLSAKFFYGNNREHVVATLKYGASEPKPRCRIGCSESGDMSQAMKVDLELEIEGILNDFQADAIPKDLWSILQAAWLEIFRK